MSELTVTFKAADAGKVDLTRIGVVSGASPDGTKVSFEPDFADWDGLSDPDPSTVAAVLKGVLAACGIWVEVDL